jgi:hypothetical protein
LRTGPESVNLGHFGRVAEAGEMAPALRG